MIAPPKPVVLLVDDSAADALLMQEASKEGPLAGGLCVVCDGIEALAFLRREGAYRDAPVPDLVLLDLNMPRLDGRGVLAIVKQDPTLRHIPIVVLSTSGAPHDIEAAYALGANSYVQKPVTLSEFMAVMQAMEHFWLGVATLPTSRRT